MRSNCMAIFLAAIIFLIPSNLFLKFFVPTAYVNGLLIDYVLPKIYLSDVFIVALLGWWFWRERKKISLPRVSWPIIVLFLIFIARQFFADKPIVAVLTLVKYLELGGLFVFLLTHAPLLRKKIVHWALIAAIVFQSLVAITQFVTQSSVFHSYLFLGEPNLTDRIGIAKMKFGPLEKILPYGTTAHPNVLAGFLVVGLLIIVTTQKPVKTWLIPVLILSSVALLLTESIAAYLALGSGLFFFFVRPRLSKILQRCSVVAIIVLIFASPLIVHLLATAFPHNLSFTRRDELNQAAFQMILHQPLWGVGLQNFTPNVEKYNHSTEVVRFVQPAHNIFLLWWAETGLLGVLLAIWFVRKKPKLVMSFIFAVFPLLVLDHYLLTIQTGLLAGIFLLAHLNQL